jgi:hypothetical protein
MTEELAPVPSPTRKRTRHKHPMLSMAPRVKTFRPKHISCILSTRKYNPGSNEHRVMMDIEPLIFKRAITELKNIDRSSRIEANTLILERMQHLDTKITHRRRITQGSDTHARLMRLDTRRFNKYLASEGIEQDERLVLRKERRLTRNAEASRNYREKKKKKEIS